MKKFIVLLAVLFVSTIVSNAQAVNPAKIKFKGIGLGTTYSQMVKALGKPTSEDEPKDETCIGGREKSVKYDGISFYLMDGDSKDGKTFEVKAFEVSAARILVSGVKVGDTPEKVKKIFGKKFTTDTDPDSGEITWLYEMSEKDGPGTTRVVFKNGKVKMIASDYLVC